MLMRNPNYPLDDFEVDSDFAAPRRDLTVKLVVTDSAESSVERSNEDASDRNQLGGQLILCLLLAAAIALRSWFTS
ncbi:hypothetical protein SH528x_002844 [Novipirellula sp. SH528]|uniref:hypothetical protein n=1 Tax=Novipirellula sp. SH528 TaxID=3454466 RepID=UPI003F9F90FB